MSSYRENKSTYKSISMHFGTCNFIPSLESYTDVNKYIHKILLNAHRFEYWSPEGNLIGLVAVYCNDNISNKAFITSVSVSSSYTGKGIAIKLLKKTINHIKMLKFTSINLEVFKQNTNAINLYQKLGFEVIDQREDYLIMRLLIEE